MTPSPKARPRPLVFAEARAMIRQAIVVGDDTVPPPTLIEETIG